MLGDGDVRFVDPAARNGDRGTVGLNEVADRRLVQRHVAQGAGDAVVDFGDDDTRGLHGGAGVVVDQSVAVIACGIGGADLDEGDVAGEYLLGEIAPDLADMARNDAEHAGFCQAAQGADATHAGNCDVVGMFGLQDAGKA